MTLSSPAGFIRATSNHDIDPVAFCTHLIHTATRNEGYVTPEQTAREFNIPVEAATYLHEEASEFDLLSYPETTGEQVEVEIKAAHEFLIFLRYFNRFSTQQELDLLADDRIHDAKLTVSVPPEFENESSEMMARLVQFIKNANHDLLVVTPFFTRFGVDTFVDHLAQATNRGVEVTILTRDGTGDGNNSDHVRRILEKVNKTGVPGRLDVYEFSSEQGNLHAKGLLADGEVAYVGSANFTNFSLKSAIEIGLIIRGPVVSELEDFFASVLASQDTQPIKSQ